MQKLAANLTEKMLRRKLISPEQAEWCAYLVECKLEQMLCFSVLIALGCLIAPLWEVLLLNWGVVFLRRKANGLHLHTFAGCMLSSLCCELTALWACEKSNTCGCRAAFGHFAADALPCRAGQRCQHSF